MLNEDYICLQNKLKNNNQLSLSQTIFDNDINLFEYLTS